MAKEYLSGIEAVLRMNEVDLYYSTVLKGVLEMQMGVFGEAERILRESVKSVPNDSNAYTALGHLYFKQERYREALSEFEKALRVCEP